ncbi:PAS domain S-box protein [Flavihumibacter sp. UBA7668]|uniref:PAS domain S-box protein n=1 Tax=Flavihumibacter sp. UBA7668 TaxID=1946542 RepID=UPI0025C0573A|nr:PAS domain S-box protein [Flavihumibacter sp. UBA7668]
MNPGFLKQKGYLVLVFSVLLIGIGGFLYFSNLLYQQELNRTLFSNEKKYTSIAELNTLQLKAIKEKRGYQINRADYMLMSYLANKQQSVSLARKLAIQFRGDTLNSQVDSLLLLVKKRYEDLDLQIQYIKTLPESMSNQKIAENFAISRKLSVAWEQGFARLQSNLHSRSMDLADTEEKLARQNNISFIVLLLLTVGLLTWSFFSIKHQDILKQQNDSAMRINAAIRASEKEFSSAFEYASIGMALVGLDGKFKRVNSSLCKSLGYSAKELKALNFQDITHPDDLNADIDFVNRMIQGSIETYSMEKRYFHKNGQIIWINLSVSMIKQDDGTPKYFISQIENITEWKNAQFSLSESEIKYRSLFENSLHGMVLHDSSGFLKDINQSALNLFGYTKGEINTLKIDSLLDKTDPRLAVLLNAKYEFGKAQGEITGIRKNGVRFPLLLSSISYVDKDGGEVHSSTLVDLTEQKEIEGKLLDQQYRITNILEGTNAGTWEWNVQTGETRFNKIWAEIIGYSLEELMPITIDTWIKFTHPDDLLESNRHLQACFNKEADFYECECRMLHRDGHYVWVLDRGKVMSWTADGKPLWMFGTHLDITRSKELEIQLREQKAFTDAVLETINVGVVVCNNDGRLQLFNKATREMHGVPEADIAAENWSNYYQLFQADRKTPLPMEQIPLYRAWKGEEPVITGMSIRQRSGKMIDVLATGTKVIDSSGHSIGAVVSMTDVTPIRIIQQQLEESEAKFKGIFNSAFQFIGFLKVDGELLEANKTALDFAGIGIEDVKGKKFWDCHWWQKDEAVKQHLQQAIHKAASGQMVVYEVEVLNKDNFPVTILFSLKPLMDNAGKVMAIIPEGRLIQEMVDARKELEQKNEELEQFASTAAHDLKEPLRMIGSFMSLLKSKYSDQLDTTANKYVDFAINGSTRMSHLITDLLDYAQVGSEQVPYEEIDPELLLLDILSLNDSYITDKSANISWTQLPHIKGQKVPIQLLFQNLIMNGIKYQLQDSVPVIRISGQELTDCWIFSVEDNGIGIPASFHDKVFQVFSRLHGKEKYSGTGMGLATCKKIVELHGGKIWIESKEGEGSCFHFTISKNSIA